MAWPEAFRALLRQGVEVVIVPTCWVLDDLGQGKEHDPMFVFETSLSWNFFRLQPRQRSRRKFLVGQHASPSSV